MKLKMVKNKSKLAIKLFIIVWIVLVIHIALKLTFNYWQPYVISNDRLQVISDFIDANRWIRDISDAITYIFNGIVLILCGLQSWWFKLKKHTIIVISVIIICFLCNVFLNTYNITPLITTIALPLLIDKTKWKTILIAFALTNVFLFLSLFLEGFVNADDMPYIIQSFLVFDYYIMLILNYFVFNFIRKEK